MMKVLSFLLCLALVFGKEITSLPGWSGPLPSRQFSGYVQVDNPAGRNYHYWFVQSRRNPATDPLLLWLNGGPGCSSLLGFMTENGPFRLRENQTLVSDPTSWDHFANVIWLESPAGVGFSYSTSGDYTFNDAKTASDNLKFLVGFFNEFPEFKGRPFFIASESYGGHYAPQLATKILEWNALKPSQAINLKGMMAGNPSTDGEIDASSYVPFLVQHSLGSLQDYNNAVAACGGNFLNSSTECRKAITIIFDRMGTRINPYDVYAPCNGPSAPSPGYCFTSHLQLALGKSVGSQTIIPCLNFSLVETWFNRADVRQALYVTETVNHVKEYDLCSQILNYTGGVASVIPLYNNLVKHIRVLIYSGDMDSCVNYLGTETAVRKIEVTGPSSEWAAWMVDNQVAGYRMKLGTNLTYQTVRSGSHMVPTSRPRQAYVMASDFLAGKI